MLRVKPEGIIIIFLVFDITGIELQSPSPLANTLTIMPINRYITYLIYKQIAQIIWTVKNQHELKINNY